MIQTNADGLLLRVKNGSPGGLVMPPEMQNKVKKVSAIAVYENIWKM